MLSASNPSTTGPEENVLVSEVSLFQGLKSTQIVLEEEKCPV